MRGKSIRRPRNWMPRKILNLLIVNLHRREADLCFESLQPFLIDNIKNLAENDFQNQSAKYWQKFPRASERELDDLNFSAS